MITAGLQPWMTKANCAGQTVDWFYPERGEPTRLAKETCRSCPVRNDCLEYAISNNEQYGIWGGASERERRKIRTARQTYVKPINAPTDMNTDRYPHVYITRAGSRRWVAHIAPGAGTQTLVIANTLVDTQAAVMAKFPNANHTWVAIKRELVLLYYPARIGTVSTERTVWEHRAPLTSALKVRSAKADATRKLWAAYETQLRTGLDNATANDHLQSLLKATA